MMAIPTTEIDVQRSMIDGSRSFYDKLEDCNDESLVDRFASLNGYVYFDTGQLPSNQQLWLLQFLPPGRSDWDHPHGLILRAEEEQADTYCRLGVFRLWKMSRKRESWFPPCSTKTIKLI